MTASKVGEILIRYVSNTSLY